MTEPITASMTPVAPADAANPQSLDCGVVGNCAFSALIDKAGQMVWCCLPRFDGDPVFNGILDNTERGTPPDRFAAGTAPVPGPTARSITAKEFT